MRLIFHGELQKRFGDSFSMSASTVSDAVEGFSRQTDWPQDFPVSIVAGDQWLNTVEALDSQHDEVHIIPSLSGGSGKFTNIILGAAVVVVGIVMLPNPIGVSLIISGSIMMAQGVLALFMKAPKASSKTDPDASKYLNVNQNTVDVGTPLTMAWGLIDLAGHWLSLQSDSSNLAFGMFPVTPS